MGYAQRERSKPFRDAVSFPRQSSQPVGRTLEEIAALVPEPEAKPRGPYKKR